MDVVHVLMDLKETPGAALNTALRVGMETLLSSQQEFQRDLSVNIVTTLALSVLDQKLITVLLAQTGNIFP